MLRTGVTAHYMLLVSCSALLHAQCVSLSLAPENNGHDAIVLQSLGCSLELSRAL